MMRKRSAAVVLLIGLLVLLAVLLTGCGEEFVCSECENSFRGRSYHNVFGNGTMCPECAEDYWRPNDYKNYANK